MLLQTDLTPQLRADLLTLEKIANHSIARSLAYDETSAARMATERANRQFEESLSLIAHELRSPMTPILSWAVALTSGALPLGQQSFALDAIIRNVRALNYLIDDLFDFARISCGKLRLEPAEMRIQEVVREAVTATQQAAADKKLDITTEISEGVPPFYADPQRVRQVLINLLNNALKFTPPGGSVTLKVVRRGDQVECAVTDTGKGIGPGFLPFVFDRYRQEHRAQKQTGGLGLGLSIVREIVELHGGTVKARSRGPHQGTTLSFRLPLRQKRARAA